MKTGVATKAKVVLATACFVVVALLFLLYGQARGMAWGFDDYINLKGLSGVSSRDGLLEFLFEGIAGPGGRFLSLLTFVANYQDWPSNPWGFARITLILHLCNGALIALLLRRLLLKEVALAPWALPIALAAASIWALLPIQASGILLPVQRMTHVASFFMLMTLYGYVLIRDRQPKVPTVPGMALLSIWVLLGAGLAYFSKENGLVVITLVALIELFFYGSIRTLQQREPGSCLWRRRLWSTWVVLALMGIAILLLVYLWYAWDGIQFRHRYTRDFSFSERLATQLVISWEYIRQTLIPRAALLGPYHDGHAVYSWGMWQPYLSLLAWLALIAAAVKMMRSGNSGAMGLAGKYLLFAVAWYMACHQVESTIIPLELYFEHRNYLAVLGFALGLAVFFGWMLAHMKQHRAWVLGLAGIFAAYHLFALQQITSLWGNPLLANEMWHVHHPRSVRAAQAVISDLMNYKFHDAALRLGHKFSEEQNNIDVAIQMVPYSCGDGGSAASQREAFRRAQDLIAHIQKPAGVTTSLAAMGKAIRSGNCEALDEVQYRGFLAALLENDRVYNYTKVRQHVLYEMALTDLNLGDIDSYARNAQQAFFDFPSVSMGEAIALELFRAGHVREAAEWLDIMMEKAPNDLIRGSWSARLQSLQEALQTINEMNLEDIDEPDNEQSDKPL